MTCLLLRYGLVFLTSLVQCLYVVHMSLNLITAALNLSFLMIIITLLFVMGITI